MVWRRRLRENFPGGSAAGFRARRKAADEKQQKYPDSVDFSGETNYTITAADCRGVTEPVEETLVEVVHERRELKLEFSEESEYIILKSQSTTDVDIVQVKVLLTRLDMYCGNNDHMVRISSPAIPFGIVSLLYNATFFAPKLALVENDGM